jgi:hypothetical protein
MYNYRLPGTVVVKQSQDPGEYVTVEAEASKVGGPTSLEQTTSLHGASQMVTRLVLAAAVALLGPLAAVSTAHADTTDDKFLSMLRSEGITDHVSPAHAIEAGHMVCQKLDGGSTPEAVANDVVNSSNMPAYHSGYFVGAAIKAYCPQYIPEEGPAQKPPT